MKEKGNLTKDGEAVLNRVKIAGHELIKEGKMNKELLKYVRLINRKTSYFFRQLIFMLLN